MKINSILILFMVIIIAFFNMLVIPDDVSANEKPEVINPIIIPSPPLTDDNLEAIYDVHDPEGDEIEEIEIKWFKNGLQQSFYDNLEIIPANATEKGEYWSYTIRAFDGFNYSNENTSNYIIINNSKPVINSLSPQPGQIVISETEDIELFINATDPDGDLLMYSWALDENIVSNDDYYHFQTGYESAGTNILNLTFQDIGENSYIISYEWEIIVLNLNRIPQIEVQQPIGTDLTIEEDTSLEFSIEASDLDSEDTLHIIWFLDEVMVQIGGSSYTHHADFAAAGEHVVSAVVSDGTDSVEYSWNLTVEDVADETPSDSQIFGEDIFFFGIFFLIVVIVTLILVLVIVISKIKKTEK